MRSIYAPEFNERWICVRWDDSIQAPFVEWKAYAEGEEYRTGVDALHGLSRKMRADRYLVDCRRMGPTTQDDQRWTNEDWFPRVISAGLRYMAVIEPHKVVAQMSVKRILSRVHGKDIVTAHFDTQSEARAWLRAQK